MTGVGTSTHNHTDHLKAETLKPLVAARPDLPPAIPEATRAFVADGMIMQQDTRL